VTHRQVARGRRLRSAPFLLYAYTEVQRGRDNRDLAIIARIRCLPWHLVALLRCPCGSPQKEQGQRRAYGVHHSTAGRRRRLHGRTKAVCQKLKNGNKCCGCVPDKNATTNTSGDATPKTSQSQSSGGGQGSQTDSKGTLLLPYFECDLTKPGGCKNQK
jgi:hypothetical protein